MNSEVLIIEDDPSVAEHIETVLGSLGHRSQHVTSQAEASEALEREQFDLALLDLQIPALAGRGGADIEFGVNLLRAIRQKHSAAQLPVLVMTSHTAEGLNLVGKLKHLGANDFIAKPFQTQGWTLTKAIQQTLKQRARALEALKRPSKFTGGELCFLESEVTLCGVSVLTNSRAKQMRVILEELAQRTSLGEYVALSGPELASRVMAAGGQNSITGSIRDFRRRVRETLKEQLGVESEPGDVIRSGGPGYRINEWIEVGLGDAGNQPVISTRGKTKAEKVNATPTGPMSQANDVDTERPAWIVGQLRLQRKLRLPDIVSELDCSATTVRRHIDALRKSGHIEFVGPAKTGYYKLVR